MASQPDGTDHGAPGEPAPSPDDRTGPDATTGALGRAVRNGLGWSFLGNLGGRVGTLLSGIVLARLLVPEEFGTFAVALLGLSLLMSLNDMGLAATIVRWPRDLDEIGPTATTMILGLTTALYVAFWFAAPTVAELLRTPEAADVLRVMGFGVVIDAVFAVPTVVLTRSFLQGRRTTADLAGFAVSTVLSIWLAVEGWGAMSLAVGRIAGNLVNGAIVWHLAPVRYRPGWDPVRARELLAFGLPLAGSSLLTFALLNVDNLVVGRLLGPTALGFYLLAFNVSQWPTNLLGTAVRRVSLAGFSRFQHDRAALGRAYASSLTVLAAVTLPACVLCGVVADPLVDLLYGDRWAPAADVLRFLVVASAVRILLDFTDDLLVAAGRPGAVLRLRVAWLAVLAPGLVAATRVADALGVSDLTGVALGQLVLTVLVVVPLFLRVLATVDVPPGVVGAAVAEPVLASVAVAVVGLAATSAFPASLWALAAAGAVGGLVWLGFAARMRDRLRIAFAGLEGAAVEPVR